ncbi:hypothetical protein NUU61_007744 [Penicillium alfredii]|uniref:Uncharacterized protein n=1 Tax=Penicillium alfredii TaxID=1506179 RepID=A0A9W9ER28_9EURO|nr:uncharacterized protein NUU61_007744 [Penicillium alfredii]KAJ5086437.1 hypothetical protein NUU61_007744 [Penicillium alfredii]
MATTISTILELVGNSSSRLKYFARRHHQRDLKQVASPALELQKSSIAAATIFTTMSLAAILFLVIWYVRRARRARRLREQDARGKDPFGQSSVSLNEDASKALDDFLMKDVQPVRTSLMFSRSRSPSLTFVVDETDRRNSFSHIGRTSYDASSSSMAKIDTLTRVSVDGTASGQLGAAEDLVKLELELNPRASLLSNVSPSSGSSHVWTTTSASSEMTNLRSNETAGPYTLQSVRRNPHARLSSAGSQMMPPSSNVSRASSRPSSSAPMQFAARMFDEAEGSVALQRIQRNLSGSVALSRPTSSSNDDDQSPHRHSIPQTPAPLI